MIKVVDTPILMEERFEVFKRKKSKIQDNESNRIQIALYQNSLPRFLHEDVSKIQEINFSNIRISSISFTSFSSLQTILLKDNPITSLDNIRGLDTLKYLKILDLRNCRILKWSSSFENVLVSSTSLYSLGLSGNPFCVEFKDYRSHIISLLDIQTSRLSYLDEIPISSDEFPGAKSDHNQKLRIAIMREASISFFIFMEKNN